MFPGQRGRCGVSTRARSEVSAQGVRVCLAGDGCTRERCAAGAAVHLLHLRTQDTDRERSRSRAAGG